MTNIKSALPAKEGTWITKDELRELLKDWKEGQRKELADLQKQVNGIVEKGVGEQVNKEIPKAPAEVKVARQATIRPQNELKAKQEALDGEKAKLMDMTKKAEHATENAKKAEGHTHVVKDARAPALGSPAFAAHAAVRHCLLPLRRQRAKPM